MKTFDTYRNGMNANALYFRFSIVALYSLFAICALNVTMRIIDAPHTSRFGMAKKQTQTSITSPAVSVTPNYNFATEMPINAKQRAMYGPGNAADVFMSMLPGTTARTLKSTATEHTKHFVLGRHMTAYGRGGLRFSLLVNGKLHDGPIDIDRLDDNATVRVCNVRPAEIVVNGKTETVIVDSTFKRGSAVTLSEIAAFRAARDAAKQTADVPAPAPAAPVVAPAPVAKPKPAKRKPAAK